MNKILIGFAIGCFIGYAGCFHTTEFQILKLQSDIDIIQNKLYKATSSKEYRAIETCKDSPFKSRCIVWEIEKNP